MLEVNAEKTSFSVNETRARKKSKLSLKQRFCYGVGHILNDLSAFAAFSYIIVFLTKVIGVSSSGAGYIVLVAQVSDGILSPVIGYCCDQFSIPYFSRRFGRRKGWHLLGTIFMSFSYSFQFMRCFLCEMSDTKGQEWPYIMYYSFVVLLLHVGFAAIQVSHLSLLPDIARSSTETVELSAIRSGFTFASGIFVYGVTWILLGESSNENLSFEQWKEFMILGFITVGVGTFFSIIFHLGTSEPPPQDHVTQKDRSKRGRVTTDGCAVEDEEDEVSHHDVSMANTTKEIPKETPMPSTTRTVVRDGVIVRGDVSGSSSVQLQVNGELVQTQSLPVNDCCREGKLEEATTSIQTKPKINENVPQSSSKSNTGGWHQNSNDTDASLMEICKAKENEGFDNSDDCTFPNEITMDSPQRSSVFVENRPSKGEWLVKGKRNKWKSWFRQPMFYKLGLVYMCTRVVVNISNSYFALYLVETLRFQKEAIAYFPLVVLVSGVVASVIVKGVNKWFGKRITFCTASLMVIAACVWFYFQTTSGRNTVYASSIVMGSGTSIMLVTVVAMTAELIGEDKSSGAFVFGSFGFLDKVVNGILIAIIQTFYPQGGKECTRCGNYIRHAFTISPGSAALVSFFVVIFCFPSRGRLLCKFVQTSDSKTQTDAVDLAVTPSCTASDNDIKTLTSVASDVLSSVRTDDSEETNTRF